MVHLLVAALVANQVLGMGYIKDECEGYVMTDDNIYAACDAWLSNSTAATATYRAGRGPQVGSPFFELR